MSIKTVNHNDLINFIEKLFVKSNIKPKEASFIAKSLVHTNMYGIDSHGVMRVPIYIDRLLNGAMNAQENFEKVAGSLAFETYDGNQGMGITVGRKAMQRAIDLAQEYNVGVVGVKNSNHFGAAGIYTRMAIEENMVGISMTNVKPLIVAPGAKQPSVGNNPFSIGFPTSKKFPFLLDMSLSVVAGGKLSLAMKKGEKIPMDWATDRKGQATDDPKKAFEGYLLPTGGFKGLGLAYAIDLFSGLLTGGSYSHDVESMYEKKEETSHTGHFMIALNLEAIIGKEDYLTEMDNYYAKLKATPMISNNEELYLPGELEQDKYEYSLKHGIDLPIKIYEELIALGQKYHVDDTI